MADHLGEFQAGQVVRTLFNTHKADGTPITLAGTPVVSVYKDGGTTESTAGVTLTVDFDARTGLHLVAITTVTDGTFYSAGSDFHIVITTGTVDSVSVVGTVIGQFSVDNRTLTVAGTEPTATPAATASVKTFLKWVGALCRNKSVTDATGCTLKADDGTTTIATFTHTETTGTYTKNKWS